jgi:hypothetical protein
MPTDYLGERAARMIIGQLDGFLAIPFKVNLLKMAAIKAPTTTLDCSFTLPPQLFLEVSEHQFHFPSPNSQFLVALALFLPSRYCFSRSILKAFVGHSYWF